MTLLDFIWTQLLQPQWYIENGGLWFILLVVFAETGLFAGFFLPGDSLLFVAGIYSADLFMGAFHFTTGSTFIDLLLIGAVIAAAGILGNTVGYWFGRKSGPYLFERNDTFFFKKKHLYHAKEFYDKHGGSAIIMARFVPFVRTFAPIIAGIVEMDRKKFAAYNWIGSLLWVYSMLILGHYLQQFILHQFGFDLKRHLEIIVIGIVALTTVPILLKVFLRKK